MGSAALQQLRRKARPMETTLLDLVQAVADITDDEREIVATVRYMLRSGRVRLSGSFRDEPIDQF